MSLFREIDEDPFFSDPLKAHAQWVRKMMRSFSDPFDRDLQLLTNRQDRALMDRNDTDRIIRTQDHRARSHSVLPVSSAESADLVFKNHCRIMDDMLADMRRNMKEVQRNFDNVSSDANTHFFKSSSVITYSKTGDEAPKVFHAASQIRGAPGGIKETRRALKDSESGVEKLAIGHHIYDRSHVIEQKRNRRTGKQEMLQDFQNMDESEAQSFEKEWQQGICRFQPRAPKSCSLGGEQTNRHKSKQDTEALKKKAHFKDQIPAIEK